MKEGMKNKNSYVPIMEREQMKLLMHQKMVNLETVKVRMKPGAAQKVAVADERLQSTTLSFKLDLLGGSIRYISNRRG